MTPYYYLGTTGEVTYEGTTVEEDATEDYSEDSYANYTLEFSQHIYPATTYEFSVKLLAPDMDAYGSKEMASDEAIVMCNTKPSKLLGKDNNNDMSKHFIRSTEFDENLSQ